MAETHLGLKKLQGRFPTLLMNVTTFRGETTVSIPKDRVLEICRFLYSDPDLQFHVLTDLCGVDFYPQDPRFEVVYLLYSMKNNLRFRVKTKVAERESIPSVESIWKAANWLEREVYDLYGIVFENHPDLRRILLWEGFEGHPLRKDFPVEGPDFDKSFVPEV